MTGLIQAHEALCKAILLGLPDCKACDSHSVQPSLSSLALNCFVMPPGGAQSPEDGWGLLRHISKSREWDLACSGRQSVK